MWPCVLYTNYSQLLGYTDNAIKIITTTTFIITKLEVGMAVPKVLLILGKLTAYNVNMPRLDAY